MGPLPEKAPPPGAAAAVGVDDDLRPVSPVSPWGPPMRNRPVGLMWKTMSLFQYLAGRRA